MRWDSRGDCITTRDCTQRERTSRMAFKNRKRTPFEPLRETRSFTFSNSAHYFDLLTNLIVRPTDKRGLEQKGSLNQGAKQNCLQQHDRSADGSLVGLICFVALSSDGDGSNNALEAVVHKKKKNSVKPLFLQNPISQISKISEQICVPPQST